MNIVADSLCQLCGRHIPERQRKSSHICRVRVASKTYLQVPLNVAKEGNIENAGDNEQEKRADKDDKCEKR